MNTPICDFVRGYARSSTLRLHMPGHKGTGLLGFEALDITEIDGADSLYEAEGIIAESEKNASALFGCPTFYSTEGSSQCIRAMLYLSTLPARAQGRRPLVLAGRNAHKTFLSAAALLDFDIHWLCPKEGDAYLSCQIDAEDLENTLRTLPRRPDALYLTCPDYLGSLLNLSALADICHRHDIFLSVDNAHGAYLKFLPKSLHPMDLGADFCCDSAHKTLPVLTGGAYLHLGPKAAAQFSSQVKNALALFGSTSPSYLILQSLDAANAYLASGYAARLAEFIKETNALKEALTLGGYRLFGDEALKITICSKPYGYSGYEMAQFLRLKNMECEFADPDFLVLMLTPETGHQGLEHLKEALLSLPPRAPILSSPPPFQSARPVLSVRQASFSNSEIIPAQNSEGRILAAASVGCPPAVPIVVCGEEIDACAIERFAYYGITHVSVVV